MKLLTDVCLGSRNQQLNIGDDPDYDPDPNLIHNNCGGGRLQSLTDANLSCD